MLDAHVHVWDLEVRDQAWIEAGSPIRRTFDLADLRVELAGSDVSRVLLVQVINDPGETADFLALADREELVAGVVGWTDLTRPDVSDRLVELAATGTLVGVRHQALAEADPAAWLRCPEVGRGFDVLAELGLVFDLMIRPEHFEAATECARRHQGLTFVLDHLGKAPIAGGDTRAWAASLGPLAAEPNVLCKLSGLHTIAPADWTYDDIRPFTDIALELFGPGRMMFGSDWPVSTLAASYAQVLEVAELVCSDLSQDERRALLGGTARAAYGLS